MFANLPKHRPEHLDWETAAASPVERGAQPVRAAALTPCSTRMVLATSCPWSPLVRTTQIKGMSCFGLFDCCARSTEGHGKVTCSPGIWRGQSLSLHPAFISSCVFSRMNSLKSPGDINLAKGEPCANNELVFLLTGCR